MLPLPCFPRRSNEVMGSGQRWKKSKRGQAGKNSTSTFLTGYTPIMKWIPFLKFVHFFPIRAFTRAFRALCACICIYAFSALPQPPWPPYSGKGKKGKWWLSSSRKYFQFQFQFLIIPPFTTFPRVGWSRGLGQCWQCTDALTWWPHLTS